MTGITFVGPAYEQKINRIEMYSDSTTRVKLDTPETLSEIAENADTIVLQPGTMTDLLAGLSIVDGLWHVHGKGPETLILPYVPGARQDRANPSGDVGFMLETVGRIINAYDFDKVVVADPHSHAVYNYINNVVEFPLVDIYAHLWKGYTGVIAPDKGGKLRATIAGGVIGRPTIYGDKVRDVSTGALTGFEVKVEEGGHYIIVDDICDGGGTFLGLGEKIREQGAYADLFVTHGIFSKGTNDLKKIFKNIYTTNTRSVHERNDVLTLDIMTEMRNHR